MRKIGRLRPSRPSPALIVATAALAVSLTGVAGALPGTNTVDSGDVVNNSLKSKDLKDGKVKTKDIKDNHIGARDLANVTARLGNVATAFDGGAGDNDLYAQASSTATCDPGEQIIGGTGAWLAEDVFDDVSVEESSINLATNSITVSGVSDDGQNEQFQATALCLAR